MTRYFIDSDGGCDFFLIPEHQRADWEEWKKLPDEDERSWVTPLYATKINGPISMIEFLLPYP